MIFLLIVIDFLLICVLGTVYKFVATEAGRGRDVVLEMTNYKHLAEDMLPMLRLVLSFALVFFACLCSMLFGQRLLLSN